MERAPMDDDQESSQNDHEKRITALERAMTGVEAEIRQLRQHMNDGFALLRDAMGEIVKRLDRQDDRMDRLDTRMDRLDTRMDRLDTRMEKLETRVDRLETRMDARFDQMASLLRWVIGLVVAVLVAMLGAGVSLAGVIV